MSYSSEELKKFAPLAGVFTVVIGLTAVISFLTSSTDLMSLGKIFMAMFFLVFGSFKLYNLSGFVMAFREYDFLAERSKAYAELYPFIELSLGVLYLVIVFRPVLWLVVAVNLVTVMVLSVNAAGVLKALRNGRHLQCACLGDVFRLPMTKVTLAEDTLMMLMALGMIAATVL